MIKYFYWALLWLPLFVVGVFGRFTAPLTCLFVTRKLRTDVVKRLLKIEITLYRDDLVWWLSWFGTDDNDVSEWWYGCYNSKSNFAFIRNWTQDNYDNSKLIRYYCRVMWLQRNSMYTFNRKFFGLDKNNSLAWHYTKDKLLGFGYYNSINIGFKAHKGIDRLMYAGRVLGIRKI